LSNYTDHTMVQLVIGMGNPWLFLAVPEPINYLDPCSGYGSSHRLTEFYPRVYPDPYLQAGSPWVLCNLEFKILVLFQK